jgi:hypothetical protein
MARGQRQEDSSKRTAARGHQQEDSGKRTAARASPTDIHVGRNPHGHTNQGSLIEDAHVLTSLTGVM